MNGGLPQRGRISKGSSRSPERALEPNLWTPAFFITFARANAVHFYLTTASMVRSELAGSKMGA